MTVGVDYSAVNPTACVRPLGTVGLRVRVPAWLCERVGSRVCPWKELPITLTFVGWPSRPQQILGSEQRCGAGVWQLQRSVGCDSGCQGDGLKKGKSALGFQRLGCFF